MTILKDHQFELLPSLSAADGQLFGIGSDVSLNDEGFHPPDDDWTVEDDANPRRGGTAFGRDVLNGPTWGWDLHVNRDDEAGALETLAAFKTAWRALTIRSTPGAVLPIRYQLDGRVRRIFGRPRRYSGQPDNRILTGYVPITVDFACSDSYTYDDQETSLSLTPLIGSKGGFVFPTVFPTTTLPVASVSDQAVVGGDAPTYPVVTFNGPVTTPSLQTDAWTLQLNRSIAAGDSVVVDLRPWAMTALLNGTSSVAGDLLRGRGQYLSDMKLEPGRTDIIFRAAASSGAGTCTVRWRSAWNSI